MILAGQLSAGSGAGKKLTGAPGLSCTSPHFMKLKDFNLHNDLNCTLLPRN